MKTKTILAALVALSLCSCESTAIGHRARAANRNLERVAARFDRGQATQAELSAAVAVQQRNWNAYLANQYKQNGPAWKRESYYRNSFAVAHACASFP